MADEIPADELAEAVEHLRERLDACKRGFGDVPQSLTDHAVEIVLSKLERLRRENSDLPGLVRELTAERDEARARVAELAPIAQRARDVLDNFLEFVDSEATARYILGEK